MRVFAAALAGLMLLLGCSPVLAQGDTGRVVITVTDAATGAPVGLARVLLDGPVITPEFTGADGKVIFEDVPSGIYRARVSKAGYQRVTSPDFEVLENRAVTIAVTLASVAGLKTLATVDVHSEATISSTSVTDSSAVRKLSDTLAQALGKLSGVAVDTNPGGAGDESQTISLEGHDPSQIALMLDGVPLNAPGTGGDLNQINTDLFSGGAVNFSPSAGSLGGGLNFRTLEPTQTWQGRLATSVGSFGKASTTISEQGSIGRLGVALVHSIRGSDSPLNGVQYLDASGFDYAHSGARLTGGELLKLRARVSESQTLSATSIDSNAYNDFLCTQFSGPLPCGFGPGNASYRHFSFQSLTDTALVGLVGVQASVFATQSYFDRDLLARFVNQMPAPFSSNTRTSTSGASLNAVLPAKDRHTLSVQATTTNARSDILSFSAGASAPSVSGTTAYSSLQLSDSIRSSPKLTLGERIGLSHSQGGGASLIGGASATWTPTQSDQFSASIDLGNSGATQIRATLLTDPAALRFDCAAGIALGDGPGDAPGPRNSTSLRATWQHRIRSGLLSANVYRQVQQGTPLELAVNGTALPPSYFPAGYFAIAQQIYQSPAGCNTSSPFDARNVYIQQLVANARRTYQGAQLTGGFQVGAGLVAEPYYDIQGATIESADPRLTNAFSYTIAGSQVPNVPLHRAGLVLDYKAPRSKIETLVDGNYVSGNNPQNLPAYTTVDAAISYGTAVASLTLAETNIFNKFGGNFASPSNAVPLPTVGGGEFLTIARPLTPRQYALTLTVKFGALTPGAQAGRPAGGRGGFFASLAPLPSSAPDHALDVAATRSTCTAADVTKAADVLAGIKSLAAAIEAAKTAAGYPDQAPADAPQVPGFAVAYHKTPASYALVFTPTAFGGVRGFAMCAALHAGTLEQAQALHLYVADAGPFNQFPLTYAPEAGLYVVRRTPQPNKEQFRLYRLPAAPPAQPFAVQSGGTCAPDDAPTAAQLLASLAAYVGSYDPSKPSQPEPAGWVVTPHPASGGKYWLELLTENLQTFPAVMHCGHIAAAAPAELKAAGIDGARPPALNFAPPFGLYLVRNPQ
jgi:hypothetical protein